MGYPKIGTKDERGYYLLEVHPQGSIYLTESELAKLRDRIIAVLQDQTSKQDQIDKLKQQAREAMAEGEINKSIRLYSQAREL